MGVRHADRYIGDWTLLFGTYTSLVLTVAAGVLGFGAEWDPKTQSALQNLTLVLAGVTGAGWAEMTRRAYGGK